ncbi:phosphate permease Pho89p [Trichomonascus vanleenenianus]|uniref:Pho89p n=1 Tax=Trichomonascus vanleenenianus TaxID=2268995 RepID=UPI003ECA5A34
MIFAFLDAWNIGANDVANSFATSISSRALSYPQAMILAALCEFLGAVLAGSRVSDAIRSKIIDVTVFDDGPAALMLLMTCAIIASSIWLTLATRIGAPVSTTHSIVGAIIGAGIAAKGVNSIHWGWNGFAQIVASWFIAPAIAGAFGSILFLFTKYAVLERRDSLKKGLFTVPFYFALTFGVLIMVIVWKGAPSLHLDKLTTGQVLGAIFGGAGGAVVVYFVFFYPYLYRKLVLEDWRIRYWHLPLGPTLWSWGEVPPIPEGYKGQLVVDYYEGNRNEDELLESTFGKPSSHNISATNQSSGATSFNNNEPGYDERSPTIAPSMNNIDLEKEPAHTLPPQAIQPAEPIEPKEERKKFKDYTKKDLLKPTNWPWLMWLAISHGWTQDVVYAQRLGGPLSGDIKDMHSRAKKYDIKTEHLYSFLQCLTSCTASFAHGSNDISNAVGPLSTVYLIWRSNEVSNKSPVPVWCLAYTAAALVIGLWTYGYHIMKNLGNRMTLQSPSRGFSAELGAAITTVFATQLSLPISTTQCIVGAIVCVGLCNNDIKAVNWRMVAWCYLGWIFTLPCAGLIAGILMGIIVNAPKVGVLYEMS